MSEHQNGDDITPPEYFISGLVVLLFGLLYFYLNHGKDFLSGSDAGALSLSAPAVVATAEPGIGNKLLADNTGEAKMPSVDATADDEPGNSVEEEDAQAEAEQTLTQQLQAAEAEKAEREKLDKARMAAEQALRDELAAERQRADEATRKLEEAQKLLAEEKARQAEVAQENLATQEPSPEPTPVQQLTATGPETAEDEVGSEQQAQQQLLEPGIYKLPDGTEIPVSDEGFEGAVKTAMARPTEDGVALMNEPMLFDDISFESGSAQLSGDPQQQIKALAALMNTYQDKSILIRGHTDNVGGVNANSLLSLIRSDSMKKQLVGLGIEKIRIKIEGVGQLEPLASNDTAEGRSRNRRIELILIN